MKGGKKKGMKKERKDWMKGGRKKGRKKLRDEERKDKEMKDVRKKARRKWKEEERKEGIKKKGKLEGKEKGRKEKASSTRGYVKNWCIISTKDFIKSTRSTYDVSLKKGAQLCEQDLRCAGFTFNSVLIMVTTFQTEMVMQPWCRCVTDGPRMMWVC